MKLIQIVSQLDSIEYPVKIDESVIQQAKDNNIVIVFGASDDLIEFRGAICDENSVSGIDVTLIDNEGTLPIDENGAIKDFDDLVNIHDLRKLVSRFDKSIAVTSYWQPDDGSNASWSYSVPEGVEWEPFNVMEDDELYCVGIVFKLSKEEEV